MCKTYFPNAALMPPCAATVCDRVGKSFDMHAILKPASARPNAARRPEPPAPTTIASYSWSIMGYEWSGRDGASLARRGWVEKVRGTDLVEEKARVGGRRWRNAKGHIVMGDYGSNMKYCRSRRQCKALFREAGNVSERGTLSRDARPPHVVVYTDPSGVNEWADNPS
jgi:hypothetical protein